MDASDGGPKGEKWTKADIRPESELQIGDVDIQLMA